MCNSRNDKYSNEFWLDKTVYLLKEKRIKKLLKIFNDSGITYTVIKGLSYNYNVYSSSELRHFGDVDILVSSKDTKRALQTLKKRL
jgi:CMP-N-acetylneuraminic acid synthetase